MKSLIFLPFVLLLGLLIGGWLPKKELKNAQTKIRELELNQSVKEGSDGRSSRFNSLTSIIRVPDKGRRQPPTSQAPVISQEGVSDTGEPDTDSGTANQLQPVDDLQESDSAITHQPSEPIDMQNHIEEAKELWKTRVQIARAQLIDQLRLNTDQTAAFDNAINNMNENLYHTIQDIADTVEASGDFSPELGVRAINAMTAAMVETYDSLAAAIPEHLHNEAAAIELTDFIDPAVADPLIAVEDKLQQMPRRSRRSSPFGRPHP